MVDYKHRTQHSQLLSIYYLKNYHIMKHNQILFGLLTISLLLGATISGSAQDKGHFQGNLKGSALPGIYWDPHYMADLSLGWRFNEKRFLGVGTGCHWIKQWDDSDPNRSNGFVPAIPLFADYVRYFPFAKHPRNAFYLGMEAGGACYVNELPLKGQTKRLFPYLNGKLGFDFSIYKNLGVNIGCNLIWGCYQGLSMTGGGGHGIALTAGFRF